MAPTASGGAQCSKKERSYREGSAGGSPACPRGNLWEGRGSPGTTQPHPSPLPGWRGDLAPAAAPPWAPLHAPLQATYGPQPQRGHQLGLPPPPAVWGAGSCGQLFFPPAPAGAPTIWFRITKAQRFPGHGDRSVSPKPSTAAEGSAVLPQGGWPARRGTDRAGRRASYGGGR